MKRIKFQPIRIAFVSDAIYPYNKGGKEKRLFDITTRLSNDGHDVHIYTMKWWKGKNVKKENGLTLHAISRLYPLYIKNRRSITEGLLFGLACLKLIFEKWDVIDVDHMPFFPLFSIRCVCILKRKKLVATWHEVWGKNYWKEYLGKLGIFAYWIEKLSIIMPDTIISVSKHTTKRLRSEFLSRPKIVTIPDGIDLKHIRSIKPSTRKSDIIFAGRLLPHKNVDVLIRAVARLKTKFPKIVCFIVGDGPDKTTLEKLVIDLGLEKNVLFWGFVKDHDELQSLIKSSKAFVLPSSREGFGIVVIESFVCETPVITVNYKDNAAKDLIRNGINGILAELNEKSIADAIVSVIEPLKKMQPSNGIEEYDWSHIMHSIYRTYTINL